MQKCLMHRQCCHAALRYKPARVATILQFTTSSCGRSSSSIPEISCETFDNDKVMTLFQRYYEQQSPVVLRNYARDFPAISKWANLDYLQETVGPDVVCDVEVGSYNQGERLILPFDGYIQYLCLWQDLYDKASALDQEPPPPDHILYLAQNDMKIFAGLQDDVETPRMCNACGEGKLYSSMLWLGPRGCVSPLHYDPLDNILVQMVGRKRVSLISRDTDPETLYVGQEHGQQYNTSAVTVEDPDLEAHPLFADVAVQSAELHPGDALFIPAKWWHHVRSLGLSASVNSWWR